MTTYNAYEITLDAFIAKILIVCPKCTKKAQVVDHSDGNTILTCISCAYNTSKKVAFYQLGTPKDPFFGHPLWLQKKFKDGIFWAYNLEHLTLLENHIAANRRARDITKISNRSIGSRLPKWVTSKKNRKELLQLIDALKKR
ncbi:hypothetical protein FGM00_15800 [Aggregatimonas sangjinii]|uniref:Uncharacterized protein n=1 Tax=Aggregatimonas sangjinii TaxID=2583587 RepID=A0A5B7SWW5_9FLAO|nr:hypothetical protein [Aggregatimonas sangjinii]QCX01498.1 hypothetical protein FGM00_15800 [Aggregatimonas sangjinii]